MDPFSLALGIGGLGLQAIGSYEKYQGQKQAAEAQTKEIQYQKQAEEVRYQAMEADARRRQLQVFRQAQQKQALALNNATTQGAQFSSGLAGGKAQVQGDSNTNALALTQALMSGRQMFGINQQISDARIAQTQGQLQTMFGSGLASIGTSLIGSMGMARQLTGGWGSNPTNVGSATQYKD